MKNPLPRATVVPFESKVSIATADGLIRLTNSGKKSCAFNSPAKHAKNAKKRRIFAVVLVAIQIRRNYMPFRLAIQIFHGKAASLAIQEPSDSVNNCGPYFLKESDFCNELKNVRMGA